MKKIKICYLIVNCKITGPMNQTINILKSLDKTKFDVSFVTLFDEEKNNSMINDFKKICKNNYCLHLNRIKSLIYGKYVLKKIMCKIKPDIIHSVGMPPYRLSLAYTESIHLVTLRNYPFEDYPSYYNKIIGPIMALLDICLIKRKIKCGETFVTCSKSLSKIYKEKENVEIKYIRNGVNMDKYYRKNENKISLRKKLNIPKDKIVFIYTAPFNERKNQEELLKTFKYNMQDYVLVLCGDGQNKSKMEKLYSSSNIIFAGKTNNVLDYLNASDIYISSSKSEGLPNSVLEAMACGLPLVLSNIPQHLELLELGDIGYSYKLGNIEDLIENIKIISNKDYKSIGEKSYNTCLSNLSSNVMSKKYETLYTKLFKEKKND